MGSTTYRCTKCQLAVLVVDEKVIKACTCDAPIAGEMSATMRGVGSAASVPPTIRPEPSE